MGAQMKKENNKKFECEFMEEVKKNNSYSMNCYYFGCIHQINGSCPILNGGANDKN